MTPQEKRMKAAMKAITDLYADGFTTENLVAILRIAAYAASKGASMANALEQLKEGNDAQ